MIIKKFWLLFLGMALFFACSDDDSPSDSGASDGGSSDCAQAYTDQVAAGQFSGQPFTVVDGKHRFIGANSFFALYVDTVVGELCGFPENLQSVLFGFETELKIGKYALNNLNTVSFNTVVATGSDSLIATCGEIEVITITDTEITGRLKAEADNANFVNGNFTVQRCN